MQAKIPNAATWNRPKGDSPGFPLWTYVKRADVTRAAGQNPIPVVNVNCMYPRNVNSSESPTITKAKAHSKAESASAEPCVSIPVIRNPWNKNITKSTPLIAENPHSSPTQKFLGKGGRDGRP